MPSIVTSILSSTVGLLWNKALDSTAAKLKDGDVTDAKIREFIVGELNDFKTKLESLSRKDLLSSYCFLKEGVDFLSVSLNKYRTRHEAVAKSREDIVEASRALPNGDPQLGILNDALEISSAMKDLEINPDDEFLAAKERFRDSRRRATDAFCIESLSIGDKIFAAKLRVASELLEGLEHPDTAIIGCLSFLKMLHTLPAIQGMFSVYLNGGVKSLLSKTERVENVKSVMLINYVLYQHASKYCTEYSCLLSWPEIEIADRRFHPILNWQEIASRKSMGEELHQYPNKLLLDEDITPQISAVNSHGDVAFGHGDRVKIICRNDDRKIVKLPEPKEGKFINQRIVGVAVDKNDDVYVCSLLETGTGNVYVESYVLYILDNDTGDVKHSFMLEFLEAHESLLVFVNLVINRNKDIIMIRDGDPHVYICDATGQLSQKFEAFSYSLPNLSISQRDEIVMADNNNIRHTYVHR